MSDDRAGPIGRDPRGPAPPAPPANVASTPRATPRLVQQKPLTREQRALASQAAASGLVERVARRFAAPGSSAVWDDLVSAGNEALVDAARTFDPSRGVPFEAFAYLRIRGELTDRVAMEARAQRLTAAVASAEEEFLSQPPEDADVWDDTPERARARAVEWGRGLVTAMALAYLTEASQEARSMDLAAQAELAAGVDALREALAGLDEAGARLVELRYERGLPLRKIAAELGVALRTVQRHHDKVLQTLAERLRARGVTDAPF